MLSNSFGKAGLVVIFVAVILSGVLYFKNAQAADLAIRCRDDESNCSSDPSNSPLFNETAVAPGQSITKTFSARNEKSGVCYLKLYVTSEGANSDFSKNMYTSITSERGDEFGVSAAVATSAKNFSDIVASSPIDLGSIDPYNSKNFSWNVKFNEGATNALQGAKTNFDIGLNFQCDESSGNSGNSGSSSSSSGTGTTGRIVGKTIKKSPTPTPTVTPSLVGRLVARLRPGVLGASGNSLVTPSPTAVSEVAGANIEKNENNLAAAAFTAGFWCKWSWLLIIILILIILYLVADKYSKKKNIK